MTGTEGNSNAPSLIVAMGASAGAIEAWQGFFEAVPPHTGMALVLVLHLDPARTSQIAEILQSRTRHVRITQAEGSVALQRDHAYVIAPNSKLHLLDGKLDVELLAQDEARTGLVDYLFTSLAKAEGARSAAIVLSGAGHDGRDGLRRVRDAGGLTIAQDPATATSPSMPQSAIDAGLVDAVLAPADMVPTLLTFARSGARPAAPDEDGVASGVVGEGFERVLSQLGQMAGIDFGDYKSGTLQRRARRRMEHRGVVDWQRYAALLAEDRDELDELYQDVLIGVTEFFRDPPLWERLAEAAPALFEASSGTSLRAWVVGCATGEEAYSLAMLLLENTPAKSHSRIQIYATDVNERAIERARRGVYPADALEHLSVERKERFFTQRDGHLQVSQSVRDCVTFAPHNALSDAPFSRMDLVTCRNVLIYLQPQGHEMLLRRLHFALRPNGLLALGRAEALGRESRLFMPEAEDVGLFRAREIKQREPFQIKSRPGSEAARRSPPPARGSEADPRRLDRADRRVEQFLLRERTTACVVVTPQFEIQQFYGRTQDYLVPPNGESRQDLLAWIRPGFYVPLRAVLKQVVETKESAEADGHIERDGEHRRVRCVVEPMSDRLGAEGSLLVSFHDRPGAQLESDDSAHVHEPLVRELEQEISDTRRELQLTIEQLESAGEEHHASNEELQSLNEELQSSNEELEASKEELQALNEEMSTINRELEEKNIDLREANSDLNALFVSTGIPTVFLDRYLCVRRFTSAATELMHLVQSDVGRSIEQIKERFEGGRTALEARRVLESGQASSVEVHTDEGRVFVRNIVPYRMEDDEVAGVCITFSEVTDQRSAADSSESARAFAEEIIETARTPMVVCDQSLVVTSVNRSFRAMFGEENGVVGSTLFEYDRFAWTTPALVAAALNAVEIGEDVKDLEFESDGRSMLVNISPITRAGVSNGMLLSFEDVTHHRLAAARSRERTEELRQDARRKDEWIAMLSHELRNPVGAISNAVGVLRLGPSAAQQERIVGVLDRQTTQITGLLDHLLDAARIISGKLEVEVEPVDVASIAEGALDGLRDAIQANGQTLSVSLPPEGSVWVLGDPIRLVEVVTNLVGNATKYTGLGGHIDLSLDSDDTTVTIRCRDDGIGISESLKDDIFEIFTQGPRRLGRSERGLGLGLPLVRTILQLHGGDVDVRSDGEGRGSEFRAWLPRSQPPPRATGADLHALPEGGRSRQARTTRVLIVDDETDAAETLQDLLEARGYEARVCRDAESALAAVDGFSPQVGLLDLGLPGMDGYELATHLRSRFEGLRMFAITGYQQNSEQLDSAGFESYLRKPIELDRLLELLAEGT